MNRTTNSIRNRPAGPFGRLALALVAAALLSLAAAQSLAALLPSETLLAVGVQDLNKHAAKIQPFIDEWQRLDLTNLLEQSSGEDVDTAMPAELQGLTIFDVLGDELWVSASASSYSPLPAMTIVARVSDKAVAVMESAIASEEPDADVQTLSEGRIEFKVYTNPDDETPLAFAQDGNFVAISTNPDALRGVLRRYQGAAEPNFTDSKAYAATLANISPAVVSFLIDLPGVVDVAKPFGQGMGFDQSIERVSKLFKTVGVVSSVVRLTSSGIETLSLQALGDRSLDPALYDLLTSTAGYPTTVLGFAPDGALGVQANNLNLPGWWAYLDKLVAELPELGIGGLDSFVTDNLGIDLSQMLFSWMGAGAGAITISAPAAAEPGAMTGDLLGDSVYLLAVKDEAAAQAGLSQFLTMATMMASSFIDAEGNAGVVQPTTRTSNGVNVTSYALDDNMTIETAFAGGYLLIATTPSGMDAALAANSTRRAGLAGALAPLQQDVPAGATSMALSNDQASLRTLADTILSQFGLVAGMAGSEDLDFAAVDQAGQALTSFVNFVADKFGGSYSYQVVDGGALRGYALSQVAW